MSGLLILHQLTVLLSIFGFFIRGLGHLFEKPWIHSKAVKILPHINDTLLLIAAIGLIWLGPWSLAESWIQAKIFGLILYIVLGIMAFKVAKKRAHKALFWLLALTTVFYIVAVAKTHLVWPF